MQKKFIGKDSVKGKSLCEHIIPMASTLKLVTTKITHATVDNKDDEWESF